MRIVMTLVMALAWGCGSAPATTRSTDSGASLFERLGGREPIAHIVEDFIGFVVGDERINAFFARANPSDLLAKWTDKVCEATGGPCVYRGEPIHDVHSLFRITDSDFRALVEDFARSLDQHHVIDPERREVIAVLDAMEGDVVQP